MHTNKEIELQKEVEQLRLQVASLETKVKELTPESKYQTKTYKYTNEERLNPPSYNPSKQEIMLAKAKYAMEEEVWGIIYYLQLYIEYLKGEKVNFPYTKESIEKNGKYALEKWEKAMDKWDANEDSNMWDGLVDEKWFDDAYVSSLDTMHCGDCTAIACSCSRCHAENMFKIPNTANWGKNEGHSLYHAFSKDWDEKNKDKKK